MALYVPLEFLIFLKLLNNSQPWCQPQQSKPKKTSRGNSGRGSNGRKNNQQASSYPVDVTQQPWYPPYQQSVDPVQMEPNHIILDDEALKKALVLQIEYYFSDVNLQKGQFFVNSYIRVGIILQRVFL